MLTSSVYAGIIMYAGLFGAVYSDSRTIAGRERIASHWSHPRPRYYTKQQADRLSAKRLRLASGLFVSIFCGACLSTYRLSSLVCPSRPESAFIVGVLPGEGIGPALTEAAIRVLARVGEVEGIAFEVRSGGDIGLPAISNCGHPLSEEVTNFCGQIFAEHGAVLAGPGGDRFVYDCRRAFSLFCKFNPIRPHTAMIAAGVLAEEHAKDVDILVIRDNAGGIYQGSWQNDEEQQIACQTFHYSEAQVRRILGVAKAAAELRRKELAVIVKPNGVPTISQLWINVAEEVVANSEVRLNVLEVDNAGYLLIQKPRLFDVIATPNMIGDIVADLGGVLLGSRGLCYGGSFAESGAAIFQTNHGAAYDLAGKDVANPVAHLQALGFLLHEQFGLSQAALRVQRAIETVWDAGLRTSDVMAPGMRCVGTSAFVDAVVGAIGGTREACALVD